MWHIALTFLALCVLLHRVEKIPSVQSLVATSSLPNIWGAVIALGFILISLWGFPHSPKAFIRMWMHLVFPAPDGPRVIMPWRTFWVSYSWISFRIQGACWISPNSSTYMEHDSSLMNIWTGGCKGIMSGTCFLCVMVETPWTKSCKLYMNVNLDI